MARRRNVSDLLESRFECPVSWDAMQGGGARRFCGECRCEVFDFAQMEPRAVKARGEASRGRLCARVTREQGRLKMLAPPAPPLAGPARKAERAGAMAAGIFGAWLSLAATQASASPDSAPPFSAPAEPEDEAAKGPGLPAAAGREASLPGSFSERVEVTTTIPVPVESVTVGIVFTREPTLSERFAESDLVFAGRVGGSEILAVADGIAEVRTELRVARRFKGGPPDRWVTYRHSLPVEAFGPELAEPLPELTPGSLVMAFLSIADDEAGRLVYEAADYSGLRPLPADEAAAYAELLEELAALQRMAEPGGGPDPAALMEWLVAAAEAPPTRKENTSQEILAALESFEEASQSPGFDAEAPPELGAFLTAAHEVRLTAALLATATMTDADLDLFRLVRELDTDAATRWLAEGLRSGVVPDGGDVLGRLEEFAELLDEATADAFLDGAEEILDAVVDPMPDVWSSEAAAARQLRRREAARPLFAELAALLG